MSAHESAAELEAQVIDGTKPTIAYLASCFPTLSETFVYREVLELRRRGWDVLTLSLYRPDDLPTTILEELAEKSTVIYERLGTMAWRALCEACAHPVRTCTTLGQAICDAIAPGERLHLGARIRLIPQAVMAIAVARLLRQSGVGHIHCHFAHAPTTVGMFAAKQAGIPFSFTGHANDLFQRRSLLRRKLLRAKFSVAISQWHQSLYVRISPERQHNVKVIRCGVDVSAWSPAHNGQCDDGKLRVLVVCRLVEKKGVDVLIRALARLSAVCDAGWSLTVIGDGPERNRLETLADELGVSDSIRWYGAIDNQRVRELLHHCDVFALPCRVDRNGDRDGIPVALIEAMACGKAVLGGDLPALRELIEHDVNGLIVKPDDVDQVAESLARLAAWPARRQAMGQAARRRVVQEFSLHGNIDRLEQAFAEDQLD